jgi:histidine ammonia-lyase
VYTQKAYTLRAIPQVVGAVRDTLYHARDVVQVELNSSNDNPLFFESREIFHGANFHGQPVAFVMDFVTIALTQLGVFSERRTNRLLDRHLSGLPEFLVASGELGLNSGFAGARYPATALVAENRTIGAAAQAVDVSGRYEGLSPVGKATYELVRSLLPTLERDRYMSDDIEAAAAALSRGEFLGAPSAATSTCVDRGSDISTTGTRGGAGT